MLLHGQFIAIGCARREVLSTVENDARKGSGASNERASASAAYLRSGSTACSASAARGLSVSSAVSRFAGGTPVTTVN